MSTPMPPVVDLTAWEQALADQQKLEDDLATQAKQVAAARRRLPMTPVQGNYTFTGPEGKIPFAEVFAGNRQLVMYHFMFGPDWENGCPSCTRYANELGNQFDGYVQERDTRFVLVSRAPFSKLQSYAASTGITTPWYSVSTAFSTEMGTLHPECGDLPGFSTFFRGEDNTVYRTYRPGETAEVMVIGDQILHMTPYGMQLKDDDSPEGWPQSFDLY